MKHFFCVILILFLCIPALGCQSDTKRIDTPANFYYRRSEIGYWSENGVIQAETRDISGVEQAPEKILSLYLDGPVSEEYRQIFPGSLTLISMQITDTTATLHLSDSLHQLSGVDLSIACACLSMTVMDLTGTETVLIQTDSPFPDGSNTKTFDRSCMILIDNSAELIYESDRSENE